MFDSSINILVVDDMSIMRKIVIKNCTNLGFSSFLEADDGQKAWDALSNSSVPVGLIISDWNMPNCTGLDFLRRVRADSRFKDLPFILVTAEAEKEQIVEAIKAGVSNYVIKPFTAEQLSSKIEEVHKKLKN